MDTKQLQELMGRDNLIEARHELAWRLSLVYSAAYDPDGEYCVDHIDTWRVAELVDSDDYRVLYRENRQWGIWTEMDTEQALKYVLNPALLMVQSGLKDSFRSVLAERAMLLPWIDPNDVEALEKEAAQVEIDKWRNAVAYDSNLQPVKFDKSGDKMIIHTGHVTFDKQTNALGTGNYWANTMHGDFIRPYVETHCNGHRFEPGSLREHDLAFYKDIGTPDKILNAVRKEGREKDVVFYVLFHWSSHGTQRKRIIHGYVLTDIDCRLIRSWNTGPSYKSYFVLNGCLPFIAWADDSKGE